MHITYLELTNDTPRASREFQSALAAHRCGDSNPMRQYLGLPLKGTCEDCGEEAVLIGPPWYSLICKPCEEIRNAEIELFLKDVKGDWSMS